jgi:hypothetical protein
MRLVLPRHGAEVSEKGARLIAEEGVQDLPVIADRCRQVLSRFAAFHLFDWLAGSEAVVEQWLTTDGAEPIVRFATRLVVGRIEGLAIVDFHACTKTESVSRVAVAVAPGCVTMRWRGWARSDHVGYSFDSI